MRIGEFSLLLLLVLFAAGEAFAQKGRGGGGAQVQEATEGREVFQQRGLFPTGLSPVFPTGVECPGISSPYASPTRYDGSARRNDHYGLHNGMDVSLDIGTPLLAVADGEVVHAGSAGMLVGNFIWVRFAPEATGLPVYVFAKYQHLDVPSPLKPGDKVVRGQSVGPAGRTGTVGGYYGAAGYPHLHINLLVSQSPDFSVNGPMVRPASELTYLDPMGLYAQPQPGVAFDNHWLQGLPEAQKRFPVSVMTGEGMFVGGTSKTVWPVACQRR